MVQGYVAAVEGAVQAPDGREHHPWRQSRPQMDGRQRRHAPRPCGEHQAGQKKSVEKIDGIVASIMALDRCIHNGMGSGSIYDERGVLSF